MTRAKQRVLDCKRSQTKRRPIQTHEKRGWAMASCRTKPKKKQSPVFSRPWVITRLRVEAYQEVGSLASRASSWEPRALRRCCQACGQGTCQGAPEAAKTRRVWPMMLGTWAWRCLRNVLGMLLNGGRRFSDSGSQGRSGGADDGTWSMRGSMPGDLHTVGVCFGASVASWQQCTTYSVQAHLDFSSQEAAR